MDIAYNRFVRPQATAEQSIPHFFTQPQPIYDFPLHSGSSLDSGYAGEDIDPFDKGPRSIDIQNMNHATMAMPFNQSFAYIPNAPTRNDSSFDSFQHIGFPAPYQASFDVLDSGQHAHVPPITSHVLLEDEACVKSEEDRSTTMGSDSPGRTDFVFQGSPKTHQQQSSWSAPRPDTLKRAATDSSVDTQQATQDRPTAKEGPSRGRPRKRIPHTAVERRYRENLNLHLEKLRTAVPNLQAAQRRRSKDGVDMLKPSKCEVLMGAVEYIKLLENENERLEKERVYLKPEFQ